MSWFVKHLNWTWVFGILVIYALCFIAGLIIGFTGTEISDEAVGATGYVIYIPAYYVLSGWVIHQKGRSLWWTLLAGFIFLPLWLPNYRKREN